MFKYPPVKDIRLVGTYPALVNSGGGYVWDDVLEYRVWCHLKEGAPDLDNGDDYFYAFDNYEDAFEYTQGNRWAEAPLALILQEEYIVEPKNGEYKHVKEVRLTEWPVQFLTRPKRTATTITDFLSPDAPKNKLDILRGLI